MNSQWESKKEDTEGIERQFIDCDAVASIMWWLRRCAGEYGKEDLRAVRLESLLGIMKELRLDFKDEIAAGNAIAEFPELHALRKRQ
jgi:hypothetical protein